MRYSCLVLLFGLSLLLITPRYVRAAMTPDEVRKVLLYVEKADKGEAEAQFNLGQCYARGEGVEKDPSRAFTWCRKAADQGYPEAQLAVALWYWDGEGVTKDEVEAYAYFSLAAPSVGEARSNLDLLDKKLTPSQRDSGRKRAKALQEEIAAKQAATKAGK